jgi:hypothetical protein
VLVASIINLLLLCNYKKNPDESKTGYSRDPDTTAFYCPFFLLKIGKICAHFLDANLI